jgi:hypothetical protein
LEEAWRFRGDPRSVLGLVIRVVVVFVVFVGGEVSLGVVVVVDAGLAVVEVGWWDPFCTTLSIKYFDETSGLPTCLAAKVILPVRTLYFDSTHMAVIAPARAGAPFAP